MSFFKALLATILGIFISMFLIGIVFVFIAISLINSTPTEHTTRPSSILIVDLPGSIPEGIPDNPLNAALQGLREHTMLDYIEGFKRAQEDDNIKGIRVNVGKYAGSWAHAEELRNRLLDLRKAGKFIYATSGVDGMDEKQYLIATAADSIVMDPTAQLEINGIVAVLEFYKPLLDRLKIHAEVVRAGSYKSAVEPFIREGASPENQEMMTSIVTGIMDRFKASVQESRKISAESLQRIIDQQALLQSSDALREHLVDAVLYEDQIKDLFRSRLGITDSSDLHEVDFKDYTEDSEGDFEDNDGEIAVVYASGGITTGASRYSPNPIFGGDMLGSDTFAEAMQEIRGNDYIKAVVIRIESPGGDARASEAMWREISLTRAVKPVIISMAGVAASGGYFIAAAGDTIVCDPATLTGSIGVFSLQLDMQEFLRDKIGINTELIETDPHADMMVNMDEAERAIIARSVDTTYARFLRIVSEGRKLTIDSVQQLAQGRVWTGEQAQQRGLVDVLGGLDTALSIAASRANVGTTDYSIRVYPRPKNPIEAIMDALGSRAMAFISPASPAEQYLEFIKCVQGQSGLQARMPGMKIR